MQSTLLGLAIAVILALVAALVGPHFVDFAHYRSHFEAEASRLVGLPVRITGRIDARLLPTPSVTLRGLEIDRPDGANALKAKALGVEFALGPLMAGNWRATDMHLVGPELQLGLDRAGLIDAPRPAGLDVEGFTIEHLTIEDGRLTLSDAASGAKHVLDKVGFNGDLRSLSGPVKGEGTFVAADKLYGYRISTGRVDDNGAMRLRLNIDPSEQPVNLETEGVLTLERGAPRYDGTLTLSRPVGLTNASGQMALSEPWRASGKISARPASALVEQIDFQYGPEERAIKFSGAAEFKFGASPRIEGVLSSRQIDLDRSFASGENTRHLPMAALRKVSELFGGTLRPPIPVSVGIGIDSVTVGGASVQSVRGDVGFDGTAWTLDQIELRAPGFTQIRLGGRLDTSNNTVAFAGPVEVDAGDPRVLLGWLEGRTETASSTLRALRARGDVQLGADSFAVERLKAEFDREEMEGRVVYAWPKEDRPARLDAELRAAVLDIDGVLAFGKAAFAGTAIERPREVKLAIELGRATIAGIEAQRASARLRFDTQGLQVERLSVADLGGAAFDMSGRIDTGAAPRGAVTLDLNARKLDGITAILQKFAPDAVPPFRRMAQRLTPAKLRATVSVDPGPQGPRDNTGAKLTLAGNLGATRIDLSGEGRGDPDKWSVASLKLDGRLDADDGRVLLAMLGTEKTLTVGPGAGRLSFTASGSLDAPLRIESRIAAAGLDATADGTLKFGGEAVVAGALKLNIAKADVRALRAPRAGTREALPVVLTAGVGINGRQMTFEDISARIADAAVRGRLTVATADAGPTRVEGQIEADTMDAAALIAGATGMPLKAGEGPGWSADPIVEGALADLSGRIAFTARRASLGPTLAASDLRGVARFGNAEFALEELQGALAGGRAEAALTLRTGIGGLTANGRLALRDVEVAALLPSASPPAVNGRLDLRVEVDGTGRSPMALIGSLFGSGTAALDRAQFDGIDPKAFDTVSLAVDRGLAIEPAKVRDAVSAVFAKGKLAMPRIEGAVGVSGGLLRLASVRTEANDIALAFAGNLDLASGGLEVRATLSGPNATFAADAGRPDIFMNIKGPLTDAKRTIDVTALVGWLTLRAVDQQARTLEAIEASRRVAVPEKPAISPTMPHIARGAESEAPRSAPGGANPAERSGLDVLRTEPVPVPRPAPTPAPPPSPLAEDAPTSVAPPTIKRAPALPPPLDIGPPPGLNGRPARPPGRVELPPGIADPQPGAVRSIFDRQGAD
ncbi:MAG: alpha-isopropylmalate/homocitrate synthase AsmA [Xanthobacteraceae bacterium]|nr:alpha-isopropylmalate/homocitrate synthase AsmA [Xanthobacteraceae bacterium]